MENPGEGLIIGGLVGVVIAVFYFVMNAVKTNVNKELKRPEEQIQDITATEIYRVHKKRTTKHFSKLPIVWKRGLIAGSLLPVFLGMAVGGSTNGDHGFVTFLVGIVIYWVLVLVGCWVISPNIPDPPQEKPSVSITSTKKSNVQQKNYTDERIADMIRKEKLRQGKAEIDISKLSDEERELLKIVLREKLAKSQNNNKYLGLPPGWIDFYGKAD